VGAALIRKTGNLPFLLEKARKAEKSTLKHQRHGIIKQGLFSKAFFLKFFAECFSCWSSSWEHF